MISTAATAESSQAAGLDPLRVLAIDVGAGTQDILVYESDRPIENCVKLVLRHRRRSSPAGFGERRLPDGPFT